MQFKLHRLAVAGSLILLLSACGFQLRGLASGPTVFPFTSLYIADSTDQTIGADVRRAMQGNVSTRVVDAAQGAQATLQITNAVNEKHILSTSTEGRVREFQLRYRASFRLIDAKGEELIPASEIIRERVLPFTDEQVVAKEAEEALLVREMQTDIVQQIVRRLATAKL